MLEQRRELEKLRVNKLDDYRHEEFSCWYAIDSQWISDWNIFVQNERNVVALGCKKSNVRGVGYLDPGPISNSNLLNADGTLKQELKIGLNYRMVNEQVWKILFDIYGGGPIIKRVKPDIYSQEIDAQEELKSMEKRIKKCRKIDRKKFTKKLNKFKDKKEFLREQIRQNNFEFDVINDRNERINSFDSIMRGTLNDEDRNPALQGNRSRFGSVDVRQEAEINGQNIKNALNSIWRNMSSTVNKYLN